MKPTKAVPQVIDPALLSKILGAVPVQGTGSQGVVIPQPRFDSFFHS